MPSTAAQCVAYIACAELPQGSWPEMMSILTNNVTNPTATEILKESSLEAVGYICQDIVSTSQYLEFGQKTVNVVGALQNFLQLLCVLHF